LRALLIPSGGATLAAWESGCSSGHRSHLDKG
jgi:hypothetical protein